jgi:hypothetical protein
MYKAVSIFTDCFVVIFMYILAFIKTLLGISRSQDDVLL